MSTDIARIAVSLDRDLARAIRRSAGKEPASAWLVDAARRKLRAEGLLHAVAEWEIDHGTLSPEELQTVQQSQEGRQSQKGRRR